MPSTTMDMGGWCEGNEVGSGGVLLISDSSDSEENDRSGTRDGMRPIGSDVLL